MGQVVWLTADTGRSGRGRLYLILNKSKNSSLLTLNPSSSREIKFTHELAHVSAS